MSKKQRKFVDDGWAIWTDGDDMCTIYLDDWLNPKGDSYVDLAIRIHNSKVSTRMRVYVPFEISNEDIEDVSILFNNTKILQAIFGSACIIDYRKNEFTSELACKGKTIDIVHISTLDYKLSSISDGTLIDIDLAAIQPYLDNDEAYFIWRMPHKSLDRLFKSRVGAGSVLSRLRDLITSPVLSEKHGYSIRINEPRLLPEGVTRVGSFHRQKLKKAIITISLCDDYELDDNGCYRIARLEEELYQGYIPKNYKADDAISYQWHQLRGTDLNFYYNITKNSVNGRSMTVYMILLMVLAVIGEMLADLVRAFIDWLSSGGF